MQEIPVPSLLWHGNVPRTLEFPDRWEVSRLTPPGFSRPALGALGIASALDAPVGSPRLEELASGARSAAILFDDMTRPTPTKDVLPYVLEPLSRAGIADHDILFIAALGANESMKEGYPKKLGEETVSRFRVVEHDCNAGCDHLGETAGGTPVYLNRDFLGCDLKIAIGCVTPHMQAGFGGGGKMVLPGIAGIKTIDAFHRDVPARDPGSTGLGRSDGNVMRLEIDEVARMSGLHFDIDVLLNEIGEITGVVAGDPVLAFEEALPAAREHYGTVLPRSYDIAVVNSYAKPCEAVISMTMGLEAARPDGGVVVFLVDSPEGQVLMHSLATERDGKPCIRRRRLPEGIRTVVCTDYPDITLADLFEPRESVTVAGDWAQTLRLLEEGFPGGASVAVIPDGTMQCFI